MEFVTMVYQEPVVNQEQVDKINKACYDNCASQWDRFPFASSLPGFIKKYQNPNLGKRVLDVGSGTGVLAKWLADEGYDLLCLDPSEEMVRRCQEKGLKTEQCSIQTYRPDGQYAAVFAILSLIHVPKADFAAQIEKLAAALPQGGLLYLGMLEGRSEGFFEGPKYPRFFAYYSPEELLNKVKPWFTQKDYHYTNAGSNGYMLFVLSKN